MPTLALYTTVFPGMEPFLRDWYESTLAQTDRDFDLVIAADAITPARVEELVGAPIDARWCCAPHGATPAQVRELAWRMIVEDYDAVVFTDSDDVLSPERVARAREQLERADVNACGLNLVDAQLEPLGLEIRPGALGRPRDYLIASNDFGLSNTAYRSEALAAALPLPEHLRVVDWYLATRALIAGMRLSVDERVSMSYRQHGNNMAQLSPPFGAVFIRRATELVLLHYDALLADSNWHAPQIRGELERARERVTTFSAAIQDTPTHLDAYVEALNRLELPLVWWACVAHLELKEMWT